MAPSDAGPEFDEWLRALTHNPNVQDDPGEVRPANLRWLRQFYDTEGAASREATDGAFLAHQVALANEAVAAVLADLHRTTSLRPRVVVDVWMENSIRISIDDGYTTPSMWESEQPEAFAEVGDYVQDQLASALGVWPVCGRHDLGLHAEVHAGAAVWWCRRFQHAVASVGSLGLVDQRRVRKAKRQ